MYGLPQQSLRVTLLASVSILAIAAAIPELARTPWA